ncbi:hypothetical protein JVU11DRAFT_8108 [Chiua virens]|nr:hypothetical protein JVU11DRAFT_8108 [Chiua virens]
MFQFSFDVADGIDETSLTESTILPPTNTGHGTVISEIDLDSLLATLPTQLSYSFFFVPSPNNRIPDLKLARRDLFDARFQLISEGTDYVDSAFVNKLSETNPSLTSALQFIDNPSDLVPLVYEGGLKTWECSLDLAHCLKRDGHAANAIGRRTLELGCGTAVPTLCILQEIFSSPVISDTDTHIHLQDYNASVLQLVTMPNVILAWYISPAAESYRSSEPQEPDDLDSILHITPELLQAFKTSLHAHHLHLRFFSGSWDTFDLAHAGGPYHLVLTSETIYHPDSLPSLVRVMHNAAGDEQHTCLVAAKTVYFGVGGGIFEFVRCVESMVSGARVETIWDKCSGVSRKVMRVWWTQ